MKQPAPNKVVERLAARFAGTADGPAPCNHRVPTAHYSCPEHFAKERQRLFMELPLLLGHSSQLAAAGDTLTQDWLGLPLITIRDKNGELATFMNVCRHRGMRLIQAEGKSCERSLVCPYHQWTYGLDGKLRNIPRQESFSDIDVSELGLVALPTAERDGLIWLQAEGRMDIDQHLAELGDDLEYFQMDKLHFCQQSVREVKANWKLIQDAFLDGYHVTRLHKNTVGSFFPDSLAESDNIGDHLRNAVARNEIENAVTSVPDAQDELRQLATFSYTTFPNAVLIFHPDYTSIISLFPQAPDRTVFVHTMLTSETAATEKQREHLQRSFQLIDEGVFAAEDLFVSEGAQRGMLSGANDSLLFGGLEEAGVRFHQLIAKHMV